MKSKRLDLLHPVRRAHASPSVIVADHFNCQTVQIDVSGKQLTNVTGAFAVIRLDKFNLTSFSSPASLKAMLEGWGVSVSYGRLGEGSNSRCSASEKGVDFLRSLAH